MMEKQTKLSIDTLKDIPETLMFPLKARYLETKKKGGIINDPKSVEIFDALDYDAIISIIFALVPVMTRMNKIIHLRFA